MIAPSRARAQRLDVGRCSELNQDEESKDGGFVWERLEMGRIKSVVGGAGDFKGNYDGISMVQVPTTRLPSTSLDAVEAR